MLIGPSLGDCGMREISQGFSKKSCEVRAEGGVVRGCSVKHQLTIKISMSVNMFAMIDNSWTIVTVYTLRKI